MESGRRRSTSTSDTKKKKSIFKAVYVSRFGEHSPGFVLKYDFHRGPVKSPVASDLGKSEITESQENRSECGYSRAQENGYSSLHKKEHLQKRRCRKKTQWKESDYSPNIPVLKLPKPEASRVSTWQNSVTCSTKAKDLQQAVDHSVCVFTPVKQAEIDTKNNKKSKSKNAVLNVITKMLEENAKLRSRLVQFSMKSTPATSGSIHSCTDRTDKNESLFGWL
ncbi:uncharacterized protein O3C94_009893 [Discoglossus pictus]